MYRTGAAIPTISDVDLANILIYLPSQKIINEVSMQVKEAINLRQQAINILNNLDITLDAK